MSGEALPNEENMPFQDDDLYPPWMTKISEHLTLSFGEAQVASAKLKQKIMVAKTGEEMRNHRNECDRLTEKWEKGCNLLLQQISDYIKLAKEGEQVQTTRPVQQPKVQSSSGNFERNNVKGETGSESITAQSTPLRAIVDLVDLRRYVGDWRVDTKQQRSKLTATYGLIR